MHQSSRDKMLAFRDRHLGARRAEPLQILDVGSLDVNGTYRPLFDAAPWRYLGADVSPGKNVDLVLRDGYAWREVASESVDVVVSGQALEHVPLFWIPMLEVARVLKPEGLCCIIVPSAGPEHRYPVDCWRFYPDGLHALAQWAQLEPVEVSTQWQDDPRYDAGSNSWKDSVLVGRKPSRGAWRSFLHRRKLAVLHAVLHRAARSVAPAHGPGARAATT